jgi:conjugal transfer pilus assembly protein TraB
MSKSEKHVSIQFLPAGSFVRVAMLNGVDAPTGGQAQSNPLPVAFHVLDVANLANKHKLDIKDCRFVAAAWGDLSSERMMGRTESLTCIINGETAEMPIKGTVIGEDGKAGVRGRLVTKQGQLLANALFTGALSGIGEAFQQSASITSVGGAGVTQTIDTDKVAQAALGGGVSQSADMLAQYYLKAADKLFPVIETDGGRTVEILVTKGAVYKGPAAVTDEYHALLKRPGIQSRRFYD